jgi:hypothetical protein
MFDEEHHLYFVDHKRQSLFGFLLHNFHLKFFHAWNLLS